MSASTSASATGGAPTASIRNPHFVLRRLHSLFGLIPIGGFLLFHLWENSQSRFGRAHFNEEIVAGIQSINYILLMEIFVLALPILFHALYGLVIWWKGTSNVGQLGYARNWMWWLQRISGIGILLFLILHVGSTRILGLFDESVHADMFMHMKGMLQNPLFFAVYVVGLALALFHLANGLWTMCITWGVTTTPAAQRNSQFVFAALGVLLFAMGIHSLIGFLTGPETAAAVAAHAGM